MNIGEAAAQSGVSAKMIRYYESTGLIAGAPRTKAGYRAYHDADVHTLRFIRRARAFGLPTERIRTLLALWQDDHRASGDVKRLALHHVAELRRQVAELTAMADTLQDLADHCHGDARPDCPILRDLAGAAAPSDGAKRARGFRAG